MIKVIPKAVGRKAAFKSLVLFWPFNPKLNIKTIYRKLWTVHFQFHEKKLIMKREYPRFPVICKDAKCENCANLLSPKKFREINTSCMKIPWNHLISYNKLHNLISRKLFFVFSALKNPISGRILHDLI